MMKKRVSIDDPGLSDDARKMLRCVLENYAAQVAKASSMPLAEAIPGVIGLYEKGFLMMVSTRDGVRVDMCLPEDAPQLNSPLASVEQ